MSGQFSFRWFGNCCFKISTDKVSVVTDPFDNTVGYPLPACESDVVTVSHDHFDHNYVSCVKGNPQVVKVKGGAKGIDFDTIETSHDERQEQHLRLVNGKDTHCSFGRSGSYLNR